MNLCNPNVIFLILGCIALERIIQKCIPKTILGILGCMSYQMIFGTMHPKGNFLLFGMKKYLTLCNPNVGFYSMGCIPIKI